MGNKEVIQILREAGFTGAEIRRLGELRRTLAEECKYMELAVDRRLEFVRWLVATGKLTEQVAWAEYRVIFSGRRTSGIQSGRQVFSTKG